MRRNNDRMLLESLIRKYGKNSVVKAVNEMEETNNHLLRASVDIFKEIDLNDNTDAADIIRRLELYILRRNGIIYTPGPKHILRTRRANETAELKSRGQENINYRFTDYLINRICKGDINRALEICPDIEPYIDGCDGKYNYFYRW
jgi:hypothetical protein